MVAACAAPAQPPAHGDVTVTSCGRQLQFDKSPSRVVTLEQSSTETLLALGLGDRMVGTAYRAGKILPEYLDAYNKIPILSDKELSGEQLRAATPDLVVSSFQSWFTKDKVGTREELQNLGLPSYVSAVDCPRQEPGTPFERLFRDYENYGKIFGIPDRANALIARQREVIQQATQTAAKPTIVYLYSIFKGLPYVAGHNGIPSDMSRILGAPTPSTTWTRNGPRCRGTRSRGGTPRSSSSAISPIAARPVTAPPRRSRSCVRIRSSHS